MLFIVTGVINGKTDNAALKSTEKVFFILQYLLELAGTDPSEEKWILVIFYLKVFNPMFH